MSCYKLNKRIPMGSVETGESEARHGAICIECGSFDCMGIYDGMCDPDDPSNQVLVKGQELLDKNGTEGYEYELIAVSGNGYEGKLYFQGTLISHVDWDGLAGEILALMHGDMMRHAASGPEAVNFAPSPQRTLA